MVTTPRVFNCFLICLSFCASVFRMFETPTGFIRCDSKQVVLKRYEPIDYCTNKDRGGRGAVAHPQLKVQILPGTIINRIFKVRFGPFSTFYCLKFIFDAVFKRIPAFQLFD